MNCIDMVRDYVQKMVGGVAGLKALLLDEETTGIVSMVYSRSNVLEKEVFLMDLLSRDGRERMTHLKCLVFVRPTFQNIELLKKELKTPSYGEYYIFFSNIVSRQHLEQLALVDESDVVKQVQEFYGDFYAINTELYSLNVPSVAPLLTGTWDLEVFNRITAGVLSVMLAMRRRPMVRYLASSVLCDRLAAEIKDKITQEERLFDFRRSDTLLLLIDRRMDPVTPILTQWTYQAMIHELLEIKNNRVKIAHAEPSPPGPSNSASSSDKAEDTNEVVLSEVDPFFKKNMFSNWGDLCTNLKQFVEEFKRKTDASSNLQSIEDMKNFMRDFPEFRKLSGSVSKHVSLVGEIGDIIKRRELLSISVLEQEMSCYHDHTAHYEKLLTLMRDPKYDPNDLLRLVLIYALRYQKRSEGNHVGQFRDALASRNLSSDRLALIDAMLKYAGTSLKLFEKEGTVRNVITNLAKGFKDVNNVYTQHEPAIKGVLQQVSRSNLSLEQFPFLPGYLPQNPGKWRPREVILFIVGGVTFEEALFVNAFNEQESRAKSDLRCIIGGTTVLNSTRFLSELSRYR
eukprot:RCo029812